ncbi:MAG: phage tail protein [Chloroflexi bacterium]|nr:MAG: phage tail protein [Chloroflexota bacterium]
MAEIVSRAVSWRYYITIDGITAAEFIECNGLTATRESKGIPEGGRTNYEVKLPGNISYSNVTLKRGLIDLQLLDWLLKNASQNTVKPELKNITISLANESGEAAYTWNIFHAYPVKWSGPQLSADSNELSMEELELTYTYFQLTKV